jgi:regulatory protein
VKGDPQKQALKRALKLLGYRDRSEAELRIKLAQSGFPRKIIEPTLEKLRSLKLLDDQAFARNFAQGRIEGRGYGPRRLERELQRKGIADPVISRILGEAFGRQEGQERAKALLDKRFHGKDLNDAKTLRRAISFLQRRGYRDGVIAEVLKQPIGND